MSEIDMSLFNIVAVNNAQVQNEMRAKLQSASNLNVSQSTISRKLKKFKITRKRLSLIPVERNNASNLMQDQYMLLKFLVIQEKI